MDLSASSTLKSSFDLAKSTAEQSSFMNNSATVEKSRLSREKIHEAAVQFESMFLSQMLSFMMPEVDTENPFSGGEGEKVFKSFMTNEYAEVMAKAGKTGISDMVEREMIRMQAEQSI